MYAKTSTVELIAKTTLHESFTREFSHAITDDLLPVLAARVSHAQDTKTGANPENDKKLLTYLVQHKHWSPFEHNYVTFRVACPIFVAREFMRHKSLSFNEVSMRYTSDIIGDVWSPTEYRKQDSRNKQSSAEVIEDDATIDNILHQAYAQALKAYHSLIEAGVAREQARAVIPVGHLTSFYVSGNLRSWKHFCDLRLHPTAQIEIQDVAKLISHKLLEVYPESWGILMETE